MRPDIPESLIIIAGRQAYPAMLARAARDALNLPVSVIGITQARMTQAALVGHVDGDRLLMLLDGEAAGAGVLSADRSCLAALIQQQTMGQVTAADPGDRPFTATDAAMVAPLADAMLARAAELSEAAADRQALGGLRFGARVADVRAMQLALDAERFRVFDLTLDFAGGVRQGALCLALPIAEEVAGASAPPADPDRMARVAGAARAELRVVIGQLQLSLADLSGMRPGDVLIWDSARPIRFDVLESIEKATLLVPKHRLAEVAGTPALPSGRVNTRQGFGALLFDRMRGVSNQISDFATVGTPQLELALLRDVLNAVGDMRSNEMVSARQALRERVERVIEARFQDQDFAPAVLAEMLGISVRALNKAFENSGTTVAMKIRERRLHAAKTDLGNPDLLRCSVTQICLTRGFSSVEHFSRSFRARFGISPRDYRSQACAERSKAV